MATPLREAARRIETSAQTIVDCDVHVMFGLQKAIKEHLSARWLEHHETYGPRNYEAEYYPRPTPGAARNRQSP